VAAMEMTQQQQQQLMSPPPPLQPRQPPRQNLTPVQTACGLALGIDTRGITPPPRAPSRFSGGISPHQMCAPFRGSRGISPHHTDERLLQPRYQALGARLNEAASAEAAEAAAGMRRSSSPLLRFRNKATDAEDEAAVPQPHRPAAPIKRIMPHTAFDSVKRHKPLPAPQPNALMALEAPPSPFSSDLARIPLTRDIDCFPGCPKDAANANQYSRWEDVPDSLMEHYLKKDMVGGELDVMLNDGLKQSMPVSALDPEPSKLFDFDHRMRPDDFAFDYGFKFNFSSHAVVAPARFGGNNAAVSRPKMLQKESN